MSQDMHVISSCCHILLAKWNIFLTKETYAMLYSSAVDVTTTYSEAHDEHTTRYICMFMSLLVAV